MKIWDQGYFDMRNATGMAAPHKGAPVAEKYCKMQQKSQYGAACLYIRV